LAFCVLLAGDPAAAMDFVATANLGPRFWLFSKSPKKGHSLFIAIAMSLRDAAVIARLAQLIRDQTAAFPAARRRPTICISQSRLLYRDMGAGAKRSHRSN
jgi:hypothetical protein